MVRSTSEQNLCGVLTEPPLAPPLPRRGIVAGAKDKNEVASIDIMLGAYKPIQISPELREDRNAKGISTPSE